MTLNKAAEAEWWFKKSLALMPENNEARHQLGYLYLSQSKFDAASAEAQQILSESLESFEGLDLAAAIELRQGNLEKVGAICQRMLKAPSKGASHFAKVAAYRLACVLWRKDRRKEASRLFEIQLRQHEKAIKQGDQSWVPRFFTASIYAAQGEKEMACTWLKKAIEAGFRDCGYFDLFEDWDGLHGYEQFEEILGQFRGDLEKMRRRAEAMIGLDFSSQMKQTHETQSEPASGDEGADEGKE
jgi:tetratricopeptide (TPR) repeat protein